ncbi:hypothetical protein FVEN_g2105 [Fusarium venenatum]|uniref:Chitin-binding type-1 domain-containing protein n=1 Tax=Fusarium venenatum TaxID=56646 RepID=A0A2L2SVP4_9HYPO|nr:uncharacterized protein FVRRES_12516 [Fusarium venenatum]KAG8360104.1 hypothetical protein FVEN_g2105 [Fusarium venenatum]KAH6979129.1 hypothetical protein EDB82DRAFT_477847 [Fusarium venenatum]CEI39825.1 unnamed protein product [Fusarium venenatum]
MTANTFAILSAVVAVSAVPAQSFGAEMLQVRAVPTSVDGICGAFNGSASCLGTGYGNCCSQFGYCGKSDLHCGTGCQTGFGSCGNTIDNSGAPIAQSTCNKACAGDPATNCGGPNALSLFYLL